MGPFVMTMNTVGRLFGAQACLLFSAAMVSFKGTAVICILTAGSGITNVQVSAGQVASMSVCTCLSISVHMTTPVKNPNKDMCGHTEG